MLYVFRVNPSEGINFITLVKVLRKDKQTKSRKNKVVVICLLLHIEAQCKLLKVANHLGPGFPCNFPSPKQILGPTLWCRNFNIFRHYFWLDHSWWLDWILSLVPHLNHMCIDWLDSIVLSWLLIAFGFHSMIALPFWSFYFVRKRI